MTSPIESIASPLALGGALFVSIAAAVVMLMLIVRRTEGFSISVWRALQVTVLSLLAAFVCEFVVFAVIVNVGVTGFAAYWLGLLVTLISASLVSSAIYAQLVRRPSGERIGMARALRVTMIQVGVTIALALGIAFILAFLISTGILAMPELPADFRI